MLPTPETSGLFYELNPRGLTSDAMGFMNRKFIGAVEDEWTLYSDQASDYEIGEPIGHGASSTVYAATYHPRATDPQNPPTPPIPCALKVLDLDLLPRQSLQLLQRETTLMSLSKHPNVLRVRGCWIDGHKLYIALRLMNKGSAADVMHYGWPGGMEEDVVRCILRQALKGLNYLHVNGFIHRDIKAANLLIDDDGTVLLGDLGVAADLSEDSSNQNNSTGPQSGNTNVIPSPTTRRSTAFRTRPKIGKRKSFVGTPCWMAPELIEGKQYDSSADIWSFGITALELCQGRPPRSREPSKEVLVRIIQDVPPTLDREGGTYKYSRAFKDMVGSCLAKDPSKRPTAAELLETPFFRAAKKKSYLINAILKDLPPLTRRQERRTPRNALTVATVDSWDFATPVHSPTSTVHHRRRMAGDLEIPLATPEHVVPPSETLDDEKDVLHEGNNRPSTSSSSSAGDISTDIAVQGQSTPPTNPSSFIGSPLSPEPSPPSPGVKPSEVLWSEESVKKSFWSRLSSGVRKTSLSNSKGSGKTPPVIINNAYPDGSIGSLLQARPKNAAAERKEVLRETPKVTSVEEPSKDQTTSSRLTERRPRPSTNDHDIPSKRSVGSSRKNKVKVGNETRPPGSRGLLVGIIGDAKLAEL